MIYEVVLDSVKKQITLLIEAEEIIKKNGMDTYKKVESRSLEQQLMALYEEVERYKDLKSEIHREDAESRKGETGNGREERKVICGRKTDASMDRGFQKI